MIGEGGDLIAPNAGVDLISAIFLSFFDKLRIGKKGSGEEG